MLNLESLTPLMKSKGLSQFERILALMKENGGKVTTGQLAVKGLYHKCASRLGAEARRKGYVITFTKGETWDKGVYELVSDATGRPLASDSSHFDPKGQGELPLPQEIGLEQLVGGF